MKTNVPGPKIYTHEGAVASRINPELQLRRSVMSCLLWESEFYEDGIEIAERISGLIPMVDPTKVATIAVAARSESKLRHIPLLIVREMARLPKHRALVADTLPKIIQRADELTEFLAIYWKEKRQPLSAQVKLGLAAAFQKFNEYELAKYSRDGAVKLRDVLFLCHAKPKDAEQDALWKRLIDGTLATPDTWEVALSATDGKSKKEKWERLLRDGKLGALALLRNLRNMIEEKVSSLVIKKALADAKYERVLPFRFISAATYAPDLEPELETAMFKCLEGTNKLLGRTILVVDVSGSMTTLGNVSAKSELTRFDAACALAVLAREICEEPIIYATAGNDMTQIHKTAKIPPRRGFSLRDAIRIDAYKQLGGGGIFLRQCLDYIKKEVETADRLIVLTDEQDCDNKCNPATADAFAKKNYLINIASAKNGIGYGKFTHIDGWSESVLKYIQEVERDGIENANNKNLR